MEKLAIRLAWGFVVLLSAAVLFTGVWVIAVRGTSSTGTRELTPVDMATLQRNAESNSSEELFPDVLAVEITPAGSGQYDIDVTLSSPYDSAARYADAWRVLAPDGSELALRELRHDHAGEQPFTRSLAGVEIPDHVTEVTVEGRDQVSGWGGETVTVSVPR